MKRHIYNLDSDELIDGYERFSGSVNKQGGWAGPAMYFHKKTLNYLNQRLNQNEEYQNILSDNEFLESLYATLATWGLHNMTGPFMIDFDPFKAKIENLGTFLEDLRNYNLRNNWENIEEKKEEIKDKFSEIRITTFENTYLVANSKLFFHLNPNIFPIVDRRYILSYFYGNNYHPTGNAQKEVYWDIMEEYQKFLSRKYEVITNIKREFKVENWIPDLKIIDNIVIGLKLKQILETR